jgi:hypothetical protein
MKEFKGELKGFPEEVVNKMLDYQEMQGNKRDVKVFEEDNTAGVFFNGFTWGNTPDGKDFWKQVIGHKNFDIFFQKYPKNGYPKIMYVGHNKRQIEAKEKKRIVLAEVEGYCLAWANAETFKEIKKEEYPVVWRYAKDIEEEVMEVTLEEIADKFNVSVDRIKIKK